MLGRRFLKWGVIMTTCSKPSRIVFTAIIILLGTLFTSVHALDRKSKFLDASAEASIEEAIAVGYSRLAKAEQLKENMDGGTFNTTTVKNGNQYDTECGNATVDIGTTQVSPDGDAPHQVNSTVVVLGDINSVSLGCNK